MPLADGRQLACVKCGLYLLRDADGPLALLLTEERYRYPAGIIVEVMAAEREHAERFVARLSRLVQLGRAFRGKVLSVNEDCHGTLSIRVPPLGRRA